MVNNQFNATGLTFYDLTLLYSTAKDEDTDSNFEGDIKTALETHQPLKEHVFDKYSQTEWKYEVLLVNTCKELPPEHNYMTRSITLMYQAPSDPTTTLTSDQDSLSINQASNAGDKTDEDAEDDDACSSGSDFSSEVEGDEENNEPVEHDEPKPKLVTELAAAGVGTTGAPSNFGTVVGLNSVVKRSGDDQEEHLDEV